MTLRDIESVSRVSLPVLRGKEVGMTKEQFLSRVASDKQEKARRKAEAEKTTIYYFAEKKHKAACAKKRRLYT